MRDRDIMNDRGNFFRKVTKSGIKSEVTECVKKLVKGVKGKPQRHYRDTNEDIKEDLPTSLSPNSLHQFIDTNSLRFLSKDKRSEKQKGGIQRSQHETHTQQEKIHHTNLIHTHLYPNLYRA